MVFTQTSSVNYKELCKLDVLGLADLLTGDQAVVYEEFKEELQRSDEGWNETLLPWKREPLFLGNQQRREPSKTSKLCSETGKVK